jgi:hypothetical protein
MTTAFQDELAEEGPDGTSIRQAAMTYEDALQDTAATIFGQWADRVEG